MGVLFTSLEGEPAQVTPSGGLGCPSLCYAKPWSFETLECYAEKDPSPCCERIGIDRVGEGTGLEWHETVQVLGLGRLP